MPFSNLKSIVPLIPQDLLLLLTKCSYVYVKLYKDICHLTPDTTDTIWLGGREAYLGTENNIWVWDMSGYSVDRTLWYLGEPNDNHRSGQDHIGLYNGHIGFHDLTQSERYIFLCETSAEALRC